MLVEEVEDDAVREPLIAEIRHHAPLLSRDIDFDTWPIEKLRADVERFEKHRVWAMQKSSESEDTLRASLVEKIRRAAP